MPSYQVICAEVLAWAKEYKERIKRGEVEPFHALLSDCPWHLKGGFMNRYWDLDDENAVSFKAETWSTLADVLHPGAFLFVFAGSRGWHRLACALEDAGLILHPSIFIWLNSQSFPKATRLRKAPKPERRRLHRWLGWLGRLGNWLLRKRGKPPRYYLDFVWEGHRYGGQILKDCATPVICAQVPWEEPRAGCIVRTGAGSLNVDAGRIAASDQDILDAAVERMRGNEAIGWKNTSTAGIQPVAAQGRWPSNFVLVHRAPGPGGEGGCVRAGTKRVKPLEGHRPNPVAHQADGRIVFNEKPPGYQKTSYTDPDGFEHVDAWRCEEGCCVMRLGEMSGVSKSKRAPRGGTSPNPMSWGEGRIDGDVPAGVDDKGTAARYYHQSGWEHERAEMRCARDPETGEPLCPVAKLDEQAGERKSGYSPPGAKRKDTKGGGGYHGNMPDTYTLDGTYGDSGGASRFYHNADWSAEIAERLATGDPVRYCPKAAKKERNSGLDDFYWKKDKASPTGFVRVTKHEWEALGEEEQRVKAETGKRISLRARGNIHPTQKPIALTKWLATLLLPPKEYAPRRIVIPFGGKMSEAIGALLAGWEEIVAIEMYQDYCDAGEARLRFWDKSRQLNLFD